MGGLSDAKGDEEVSEDAGEEEGDLEPFDGLGLVHAPGLDGPAVEALLQLGGGCVVILGVELEDGDVFNGFGLTGEPVWAAWAAVL